MDALSMIMRIRLTPGPALAHVFVDVLAPCMLPVRLATSVVLGAKNKLQTQAVSSEALG